MSAPENYIACTFSEGMLPTEYSVRIHISAGDLSLFAPKGFVRVEDEKTGKGLLQVRIVDPDNYIIALPAETIEFGKRFVEVQPEELQTA